MRQAIYPTEQSHDRAHAGLKWSLSALAAVMAASFVLMLESRF